MMTIPTTCCSRWTIILILVSITLLFLTMASPLVLGDDSILLSSMARSSTTTTTRRKRIRQSPACYPRLPTTTTTTTTTTQNNNIKIKRIYFAHMRKAGGTTLMAYLQKVAQFHKLQLIRVEAGPEEVPGTRDDTLYVTHLRDPIQRSLSHFQFEGRWQCSLLQKWKKQQHPKTTTTIRPTPQNSHSLEEWIRTEFQRNDEWTGGHPPTGQKCTSRMWMCSTNCYIKWMNYQRGRCVRELEYPDYFLKTTLDRLYNYHLIIDMERLFQDDDDSYVQNLERFFGVPGLLDLHVNVPCDKPSKEANQKFPLQNVTSTEQRLLLWDEWRERNRLDYVLYNQTVGGCDGVSFPNQVLADHV